MNSTTGLKKQYLAARMNGDDRLAADILRKIKNDPLSNDGKNAICFWGLHHDGTYTSSNGRSLTAQGFEAEKLRQPNVRYIAIKISNPVNQKS